jgi:hypothetical protein
MKKTILLLTFLIATSSYSAETSWGKRVIYRVIFQGKYQGVAITDIAAKNIDNHYLRETELYVEGAKELIKTVVEENEIKEAESTIHILQNCQKLGGSNDRVYAAGRLIQACKLSVEHELIKTRLDLLDFNEKQLANGYAWIGEVPVYGIIKLNTPELIMDLTYYRWGKI